MGIGYKLWAILMLLATEKVSSFQEDFPEEAEEEEVNEALLLPPKFTTRAQNFSVATGEDITFPCEGDNFEHYPLIFKANQDGEERLLYVGESSVSLSNTLETRFLYHICRPLQIARNSRLRKEGNSYLLHDVRRNDDGAYICRIEARPVVQLAHYLSVEFAAKVHLLSPKVHKVAQGTSVTLKCGAEGNPSPRITWSRKDGHLPSGAKMEEGISITLENVDRYVEGTYVCTASNRIGHNSASMVVEVMYPPEIQTEQSILHTGEGDEAKLVCIVHGRPPPQVTWLKDGALLLDDNNIRTHDGAHKHTLTIKNVNGNDFGNYTCRASNEIGNASRSLHLTGRPKAPRMTSSPAGGEDRIYTITWETESFSPITQYRLRYRKLSLGKNASQGNARPWHDSLFSPSDKQWNIFPRSTGIHKMAHPIINLDTAQDYEAVVMVENKYGWSSSSNPFRFHTKREEPTTTTSSTTSTHFPMLLNSQVKEVAVGHSSKCDKFLFSEILVLSSAVVSLHWKLCFFTL